MLLTCPDCAAGYEVPDHLLDGPARSLRCALCGCEWEVKAAAKPGGSLPEPVGLPVPVPVPVGLPVIEPEPLIEQPLRLAPEPLAELHAGMARDRQVRRGLTGWALSVVVLVVLGWAAMHWRHEVIAAWPPSARAYQAVGLD